MADNGSLSDILIAVTDGPKGFPEAIEAGFPQRGRPDPALVGTTIPRTVVTLLTAPDPAPARVHVLEGPQGRDARAARHLSRAGPRAGRGRRPGSLGAFEAGPWGQRHPAIARSWRAKPGPSSSRISRRPQGRAPDRHHDQRHRGAELQAAPRGSWREGTSPLTTPQGRCHASSSTAPPPPGRDRRGSGSSPRPSSPSSSASSSGSAA